MLFFFAEDIQLFFFFSFFYSMHCYAFNVLLIDLFFFSLFGYIQLFFVPFCSYLHQGYLVFSPQQKRHIKVCWKVPTYIYFGSRFFQSWYFFNRTLWGKIPLVTCFSTSARHCIYSSSTKMMLFSRTRIRYVNGHDFCFLHNTRSYDELSCHVITGIVIGGGVIET
jgi:hypothetical protein